MSYSKSLYQNKGIPTQAFVITRGKHGYGFTLSGQSPCYISWVVASSPADRIGLSVGDSIVSVNGKDVSTSSHDAVVKLIGMSSGALFLNIIKSTRGIIRVPDVKSGFIESAKKRVPSYQGEEKTSFSRTEKVLQDLHSGIMFKKKSSTDDPNKQSSPQQLSLPDMVLMTSVVAYLGTVELEGIGEASVEDAGFNAVQRCVQALRMEQHIHQRVLMMVTQSCVKLCNADGAVIALYKATTLKFSSGYMHDNRFFYLVTKQDPVDGMDSRFLSHIFMVDPDISRHQSHVDKARRFGIECTADENGTCVEFPTSPRALLAAIRLLHVTAKDNSARRASWGESSDQASQRHQASVLTRGESTLPRSNRSKATRTAWIETSKRTRVKSSSRFNSNSLDGHASRSGRPETDPGTEVRSSPVPPPMQKLSLGKYKFPDAKRAPPASLGIPTRKQKPDARSSRDKRRGRLFPSHVTSTPSISKSYENVNASDEDLLSGASSIESLASNVSLPSCINGSSTGNFSTLDRPMHRNSTPNTPGEEGAGRISHWAVSFDRMLEDPLGVKYFKEFLRKEFSEENILFWEACEDLRRCDPHDEEKLTKDIKDIYDRFLSLEADMGVNIDGQGQQQAEEAMHSPPHPNIFTNQQHQVYTLMKLDSYSRFLKSPLYRHCMLSEMEGRPLPLEAADNTSLEQNGSDSSRGASRSLDSDTLQRQTKKFKGSRKGIFGKIRSKSQREKFAGTPLTRQSSGDSTGSEPCTPLQRTASLPTNSLDPVDASRLCHVTLWDHSSTVLCAKQSGETSIGEKLGEICKWRGVSLSTVDVFLVEQGEAGEQRRPLSLDLDIACLVHYAVTVPLTHEQQRPPPTRDTHQRLSVIISIYYVTASQSIVVERRTLLRIDVRPIGKSLSVKSRPTKSIADVLDSILNKYDLSLDQITLKTSDEGKKINLYEPVSTLDGLRVIAETKPEEFKPDKQKGKDRRKLQQSKSFVKSSSIPDKKDTEELIQIMASLQSSKLHDQRGLLCKENLELPEFLKIKPIENPNNNNNSNRPNYDSDSTMSATSSGHRSSACRDTSGRRRSKSSDRRQKLFVELNTYPRSLTTFKPIHHVTHTSRHSSSSSDDVNDLTIIEDSNMDLDFTLVPLPTPPQQIRGVDLSMPDYSPPTPIHRK